MVNPLTPNDHYSGPTAPPTSKRYILYIYSTNIGTEYFKHDVYSQYFSLQNAVCFIILTNLVPVLFTFYSQGVLKLRKIIPAPKDWTSPTQGMRRSSAGEFGRPCSVKQGKWTLYTAGKILQLFVRGSPGFTGLPDLEYFDVNGKTACLRELSSDDVSMGVNKYLSTNSEYNKRPVNPVALQPYRVLADRAVAAGQRS